MKRFSLLLCITLSFAAAEDIDTLIQKAYENSFTLKAMQKEVEINKESTKSASSWDNPILSAGFTDVMFDDITDRSKEAMQTQYVTLSQMIPLGDKKAISKRISKDFTKLSQVQIQDQKAMIKAKITLFAYQYLIINERLKLIDEKNKHLKTIKKLQKAYQLNEENSLGIDVLSLKLENKKERLAYKREEFKKEIEKFMVEPISTIDGSLSFKEKIHVDIDKHPKIALLKQKITLQKSKSDLAEAKESPDIKVSGGYFQRYDRDDYVNLSFSIPLLVQGKEEVNLAKAKLSVLKNKEELAEIKNRFEKEIQLLQKELDSSKKNYDRYQNRLIPKQKKIIKFLQRKSRIGKADLIQVIKSKNLLIDLKELSLDELKHYFTAYAKLRYYQ